MAKIPEIQKSQINFNGVMAVLQDAIMSRLNCHNIGRILEFDKETQRCTVELMQLKQFNERVITPAPITDIPLIILGSGGGHITMPNPEGTICLLLFLDRNIDNFLATGEQYVPETSRMHDFSDCVALTTFTTLANPLTEYDENAITIMHEEIIEEVKHQSYIKVYPTSVQIKTQGEGTGALVNVSNKVSVSNEAQSLADLMQAFLSACENIAVNTQTGVILPASKQAFTELKTKFSELLETYAPQNEEIQE